MLSTTSHPAPVVRALLVALGLWLIVLTLANVFVMGRQATDENIFINPPSRAYVTAEVVGTDGGRTLPDQPLPLPRHLERELALVSGDRLAPGDLLLAVDGSLTDTVEEARRRLAADGPAEVWAFRVSTRELMSARVPRRPLADALRSIANTVVVIAVTPAGASDRAGMLPGDVITRINEQGFSSALEADGVMRQSAIGRETAYDILRGGEALSLMVRLAAFGIQFWAVLVVVVGLLYIVAGMVLAVLRTHIKAARYLGLAWMCVGCALALFILPRRGLPLWFQVLTGACVVGGALFGSAAWLHALHYFPRERSALLARRWLVPTAYGLAALATGVVMGLSVLQRTDTAFPFALVAFLVCLMVLSRGSKRDYGSEERELARPLGASLGVAVMFVITVILVGVTVAPPGPPPPAVFLGLAGLFLLALGVHVYVIGRYRLLESDLRVRRNVQYLVLTSTWTALVVGSGVWLWWILVQVELPLPNVRLTGDTIELLQTPLSPERRTVVEKGALIAAAVVLAFVFRGLLKRGHRLIAEQYYREGYDYRKAARELGDVMGARMDLDGLADGLLTVIDRLMPVKKAGVAFTEGRRIFAAQRSTGFEPDDWDIFCRSCLDDALGALREGSGEYDTEYAPPRLRLALRRADIQYLYPIRGHDQLRGVLFIGEKLSEAAYTSDDFTFLSVIASQASLLVENAFLYESLAQQERARQELALARRIQIDSLPREAPVVAGLEVAGRSVPAQDVGGDFFDYLTRGTSGLGVVIGDVSGKGTSAALYMSKVQGIIRTLHAFDLGPSELLVKANELLGRDLERRAFVTALGGFFDTTTRTLVVARAGHLPLLHFKASSGQVRRLLPGGLGLGLTASAQFERELSEHRLAYAIDDVFLFVTDGIAESHDASGNDFGDDRLADLLADLANAGTPAGAMVDAVMDAVAEFTAGTEQQDDQTVVVVRAVSPIV
jgi:serine phosphatase RsbU (regulator of sigma subunit)